MNPREKDMDRRMKKRLVILAVFAVLAFPFRGNAEETMTWEACLKESVKNNPDLISAEGSILQQNAAKAISASSLFPQVDASLGASTTKANTAGVSSTTDSYSYGIAGTQLFFDAFKTLNTVKQGNENVNAARYNFKFVSSDVRKRLRTAFVELLKAQESISVAEDIAKIRRGNYELITLRYASGLEHRGALLTAEANLADANSGIAQAKRSLSLAQRQLSKEMGRKIFVPITVQGEFSIQEDIKVKPDLDTLVNTHPSLLVKTAKKNAAAYGLKTTYADFFPKLTGQAGANKSDAHWPPENKEWNLGLSVSLPLFEGGLRKAQVEQAQAVLSQAEADERSTKDGLIVTLEESWDALQNAGDAVDVQQKLLAAAEERSNIAESQYSIGFISYDNWSIIEDNLVSAKNSFLAARANLLLAEANWIQAKGETLEYAAK